MIIGECHPTVLLVEDDRGIAELITFVLEDAGFVVYTEGEISSALRTFDDLHPRVVITDLMLPDGLGSELINHLRCRAWDTAVGSIWISAHPQARQPAESSQADAYLSKPFDLDDLSRMVEELVN
jgi:two-component system phosphate regulon response regulator PhoB